MTARSGDTRSTVRSGRAEEEEEAITKQKSWQPQIKKIVKYFCLSCLIYSPEPGSVEE